ncbi:MAG: tryptophan--tRNA ligase [Candidatus Berkelbacteria bacterium]|nr:tryptophan--tRNA ligase [Candidatus Berkelbacteria bacterium]
MQKRLVSGIQPSGTLHIGNYLGALKQWVDLQNYYDCFFSVVDYHALTLKPKPEDLRQQTLETVAMLIALGVDPKNCVLFVQSQIPEHAELNWLLSPFVTVGQLNRMTQYKEKSDRHGQNIGLLTYPVLMAADILMYDAQVVPVGEDQVQHLELAREVARSFNAHAGQTFTEPKPLLNKAARIMALNDPKRKMSKSIAGSAIGLLDDEAAVTATIRRAVTDSDPNSNKMSPGIVNLFTILEGFSDEETVKKFQEKYQDGQLKYSELKEQLIEDVMAFLKPVQKGYQSLMAHPDKLELIIAEGTKKARPIAAAKMALVKKNLGLI